MRKAKLLLPQPQIQSPARPPPGEDHVSEECTTVQLSYVSCTVKEWSPERFYPITVCV